MKRTLAVVFFATEAACAGTLREDIVQSADGAQPLFRDCGAVLFDDSDPSWPFMFKAGLVPETDSGFTAYPFSVRFDDFTGEAVFYNADGDEFHSIAPSAPTVRNPVQITAADSMCLLATRALVTSVRCTFAPFEKELRSVELPLPLRRMFSPRTTNSARTGLKMMKK